jgi:hypothetical protein
VRKALYSLQFVEKDSVTADITTKRATFRVKDNANLDVGQVKAALEEVGFKNARHISGPAKVTGPRGASKSA